MKKLLCIIVTAIVMMGMCTMAGAETPEQRVDRVYPDWKEDWEEWSKKELVSEYDTNMKALVVGVGEHESRFRGDVGEKYRGLMTFLTIVCYQTSTNKF